MTQHQQLDASYEPEFESIKDLLMEMAVERSPEALPRMIVRRFADRPHAVRARAWLIRPGDACASCEPAGACSSRASCLHLVASAGGGAATQDAWARLDAAERRLPLGEGLVGTVATTGKGFRIPDTAAEPEWQAAHPWCGELGVVGVGVQPIVFKGEVFGVIAALSGIHLDRVADGGFWLKLIAHQAATSMANARAFAEIEQLKARLELENACLREEIDEAQAYGEIIGESPPLANLLRQVELVAPTDATVLILGESGTGKELVARQIHRRSQRRERPLIKVNCAAVPPDLYESEFFGHLRGAFTGAVSDRIGRFQAADGGTLFLDEVGEIPPSLQVKLLRVIQDGEFERVGENRTRQVDVRIIAATNRDLRTEMAAGRFRGDLYYRLSVFPVEVVPLRARVADIPNLASHFLALAARRLNRTLPDLSASDIAELQAYEWPGNVRELQNVIERAVITAQGDRLRCDLPPRGLSAALPPRGSSAALPQAPGGSPATAKQVVAAPSAPPVADAGLAIVIETEQQSRERSRRNIIAALKRCRGRIYGPDGAAALLGLPPTTLCSRIRRLDITRPFTRADP